jgi:phage baseplate assembly protein W
MNIDYPFHFQGRGRTATTGDARHIRDMIEQLFFTSPGERVNRPNFGSGILGRLFEPNSPEQAAVLQVAMQAAMQQELGDLIQLQALEIASEDGTLRVVVSYMIRRTGESRTEIIERSGV